MSKTDKTRPMWVRKSEQKIAHDHSNGYCQIETLGPRGAFEKPWRGDRDATCYYEMDNEYMHYTNAERGIGPKHAKWAKRMHSKKQRRRAEPWTSMTGRTWTEENYRINW